MAGSEKKAACAGGLGMDEIVSKMPRNRESARALAELSKMVKEERAADELSDRLFRWVMLSFAALCLCGAWLLRGL